MTVIGGSKRGEQEVVELDTIEEYHQDIGRWKTRRIKLSQKKRFFGTAIIPV